MSTLTDAVQARYPNERLVQLTNKNSRSATTVNTTMLGYAADDATAEFEISAGTTFDATNAQHIRVVCPGVIAFLAMWNGQDDSEDLLTKYRDACSDYAKTNARRRITPITNRTLGPTDDVAADGTPRRPEFDRPRFRRLDVDAPEDPQPTDGY